MTHEERLEKAAAVIRALKDCGDEWMDVLVIVCKFGIEHNYLWSGKSSAPAKVDL